MVDGKLYSVWTDDEVSPVFSVYRDDTEAYIAFRNLILTIRDDIKAGHIEAGTDSRLSLYCHGFYKDGVIRGLCKPFILLSGDDISSEVVESDCDIIEPDSDTESEVYE